MRTSALLGLAAALVAGCGVEPSKDDLTAGDLAALDGKSDALSGARAILPADAQHLYFGTTARAYVSDVAPLAFRWFAANASGFKVGVAELDENGNPVATEHVGFKLQRAVKVNGAWKWTAVTSADSDGGSAAVKVSSTTGPGLYLVTATASPLPADLTIDLTCGGTSCAVAPQPSEACGSHLRCDAGLFCSYTFEQACGGSGRGTCAIRPVICPLGIRFNPVCGCDGVTYDGGCRAAAAGTSVAHVGSCDVNVVGGYSEIDANGAHYDYTFNADGSFLATEQPACAFTNPRCLIKLAPATGFYTVGNGTLHLGYTSDFRSGETADFTILRRGAELTGTDFGVSLDLTRTR
jgi:hypothetical protein